MVEVIKSSFIPKKEIKKKKEKMSRGINVFFLMSLIVFLSTIIAAVSVYFWKIKLERDIKKQAEIFKQMEEYYNIETFQKLILLDNRIKVGKELLNKHYSIKPIFTFLEKNTIPDIFYKEMELVEEGDKIKLSFKGGASDFSDIVRQKDIYTMNPNIKEFRFTNITRSKLDRSVIFDMYFEVEKKYLTDRKLLIE